MDSENINPIQVESRVVARGWGGGRGEKQERIGE
jgi:hypothetical protein